MTMDKNRTRREILRLFKMYLLHHNNVKIKDFCDYLLTYDFGFGASMPTRKEVAIMVKYGLYHMKYLDTIQVSKDGTVNVYNISKNEPSTIDNLM